MKLYLFLVFFLHGVVYFLCDVCCSMLFSVWSVDCCIPYIVSSGCCFQSLVLNQCCAQQSVGHPHHQEEAGDLWLQDLGGTATSEC